MIRSRHRALLLTSVAAVLAAMLVRREPAVRTTVVLAPAAVPLPATPFEDTSRTQARADWLEAVRDWARRDLDGAVGWATRQDEPERSVALVAALHSAAERDTEGTLTFVEKLAETNPSLLADAGAYLISALGQLGAHERAASFAAAGPPGARDGWLTAAYHDWGKREPEAALDMALGLDDPARQRAASRAAMAGWASVDPARLAECALQFPAGPERTFALVTALRAWTARDRGTASAWVDAHRHELGGGRTLELLAED